MAEEYFPLIDEQGAVIGKATRKQCHNGSRLLHPVVHNHIFNPEGKLFLQKRSMSKDIQPGRWDTSVGGHVDYGEEIEQAMLRESREELGVRDFKYEKIAQYIFDSDREREMVNVFVTRDYTGPIEIDPVEVDEGRFWSIEEIDATLGQGVFTPNFEQEFTRLRDRLIPQTNH